MSGRKPKPDLEKLCEVNDHLEKLEQRMGRDLQRYEKLIDEKERLISHYIIGQAEEKHLPIGETLSLAEDLMKRKPAPIPETVREQKDPPPVTIDGSDDRYVQMKVRVTEREKNQILANMERAEFGNFNSYARKMLLDGYIIHWDYQPIRELTKELSSISRNINQITKRANSVGSIYAGDFMDIQRDWNKLQSLLRSGLTRFIKEA